MNNTLKAGLIGVLIGGILVWGAINITQNNSSTNSITQNSDTLDAHFIEQMVLHHRDAITMATIAKEKAQRPELKLLATIIIEAQTKENEQMRVWYKDWFKRELPKANEMMQHHATGSGSILHMGIRGDETDLESLEQAVDFDRAFLEAMIPHHQMAVMMASVLKDGTQRPEMKTLADNIITSQTVEIEQMRSWLKNP